MRIVSITDRPKSGDYSRWNVTFESESGAINKTLRFGGVFAKVVPPAKHASARRGAFVKLILEVERDFAGDGEHFSRVPTPLNERLYREGLALRPDLF
jgi:uncharacterized heparinase superfamily protein